MSVKIEGVKQGGRAQALGILPGDLLLSINGQEVTDVLDYRFLETERDLKLRLSRGGREYSAELHKPQYAELGLEFETYLMDRERSCRNKCVFCFIDQLPRGMRETLYFKDDDDRLSFLFGNYITLTNIDDREVDRILKMRVSPINVSVHTMNPELRCKMMNNRFAGDSLRHLYRLAEGGIRLNCQIVLCPGINDGAEPKETAGDALELLERYGEKFLRERGSRTVYGSDELYLLAGRPLPPLEFYEDFPQIENGVGMLRDLEDEFNWALELPYLPENAATNFSIPCLTDCVRNAII